VTFFFVYSDQIKYGTARSLREIVVIVQKPTRLMLIMDKTLAID